MVSLAALSRLEFAMFLIRWASCCISDMVKYRPSLKRVLSGETTGEILLLSIGLSMHMLDIIVDCIDFVVNGYAVVL